ncbi:hypothetical protein M758_12G121400 [Ceratodon purpureus]|nr:hypothetical protein M758_12G121400 [Ceratodon purpureus]
MPLQSQVQGTWISYFRRAFCVVNCCATNLTFFLNTTFHVIAHSFRSTDVSILVLRVLWSKSRMVSPSSSSTTIKLNVGISPGPRFVVSQKIPANGIRMKAGESVASANLTPDKSTIYTTCF